MSQTNDKSTSSKVTSVGAVALAYSGGLDTSFCAVYLRSLGHKVITVTVDTGGFSKDELANIADRAKELGASEHITIDARTELFERFAAYVVKGNILRGQVYPLCVGAERTLQAEQVVKVAKRIGATAVAHGCTGAGNDQVRFDVAIRTIAPELEIIAPIRDKSLSRDDELSFLEAQGFSFDKKKGKYSVNVGLLGTTVGGGETHDPWASIPEEAFELAEGEHAAKQALSPENPLTITVSFEQGLPTAIDGKKAPSTEILIYLNRLGSEYKIGRGVHLGDTALGIKGRIAFSAPGAIILITAHRELEKLTLTKWQSYIKEQTVSLYGMLLHEGQWHNPAMRDIEASIDSSQRLVSGDVRLSCLPGRVQIEGIKSPHSLQAPNAKYGEESALWNGRDAEGFCKLVGIQSQLAYNRR